jgi:hypothetical protein
VKQVCAGDQRTHGHQDNSTSVKAYSDTHVRALHEDSETAVTSSGTYGYTLLAVVLVVPITSQLSHSVLRTTCSTLDQRQQRRLITLTLTLLSTRQW